MIDLNDGNTATSDSKSETLANFGDKEQKSADASPQLPPISGQIKKLNFANESESVVQQYPLLTESLNVTSENIDKKEPKFKHSSEVNWNQALFLGNLLIKRKVSVRSSLHQVHSIPKKMLCTLLMRLKY
ncbi:hypothetical protein X798_04729 [Onchocerca flexuosa]|uniref:Uncharacterized protein n=1 Tax=Onchocerca flexuosa TaxID=387005 RepID=A0A238BU93_9BILA|nr:hypothetical protein X798_04729 [Onchocerca flexuosa]